MKNSLMARLTADEGVALYQKGVDPVRLVYYDPEEHSEEMKDLATGLIGAMLKLGLHSASGPEFGSRIPLVVTYVPGDVIRIMIDPIMKKGSKHVKLTAFSYTGERMVVDTSTLWYAPWELLVRELLVQEVNLSNSLRVEASPRQLAYLRDARCTVDRFSLSDERPSRLVRVLQRSKEKTSRAALPDKQ